MPGRVLILENDKKFATELRKGLQTKKFAVDVFPDGQAGIDHALEERPDLILIAVELPKENGYLICKKIKKNAFLSSIPVVLMSSSSDADHLFSEHRKLRTQRAELYLKKPIDVKGVLRSLTEIIAMNEDDEADAEQVEEDEVFEDEATQTGARLEDIAAQLHGHPPVDAEMDSFAESAFSAIVMEDRVKKDGRPSLPLSSTPPDPLRGDGPPGGEYEVASDDVSNDIDDFIEDQLAQHRRTSSIPAYDPAALGVAHSSMSRGGSGADVMPSDTQEVRALHAEITDLRQQIAELTHAASKADRLETELREQRARPSKPAIGISSREYLDLREALNGKDKELLALRDQLSSRDKQMLELRDSNLQLERLGADLQDRIVELEDDVQNASDRIQSLTADKEAANKRAEDFKSRFERSEAKGKKLEQELDTERQARASETQRLQLEKEEAIAESAARHQSELATLRAQHESDQAELRRKHADEIGALQQDFESSKAALVRDHETLVSKTREDARIALENTRGEHATQVARMQSAFEEEKDSLQRAAEASRTEALEKLSAELRGQMQRALREAEETRQRDLQQARAESERELERTTAEWTARHDEQMAALRDKHDNELGVLGRKLSETEHKLDQTKTELEQTKKQREDLSSRLSTVSEERDRLSNELAVTQSNVEELEQVKQEHLARIDVLVGAQRELEAELHRAQQKMSGDEALLERARKAFTIGFMLLEEQQKNVVGQEHQEYQESQEYQE